MCTHVLGLTVLQWLRKGFTLFVRSNGVTSWTPGLLFYPEVFNTFPQRDIGSFLAFNIDRVGTVKV